MQNRFLSLSFCLTAIPLAALLSGCAVTDIASPVADQGTPIKGNVHGGQQPVVGAHVYLLAANISGTGSTTSNSLLLGTFTGLSDSIGAYVLTGSDGSFSITGDYSCTAGTQVYVYALGGNPGAGVNSAAGFLAALGQCPTGGSFAASTPFIYMNEVSTVAAAYAMAPYAVDAQHVYTSGSILASTGISNAFGNAANLVSISTGTALTATPIGNGIVPQATINSIANILASCVNSTGPTSTPCSTLFANAKSGGSTGTTATDTASAAINIAHHPAANVAALYGLTTPALAFSPALTKQPSDYSIGVVYSGTGATGGGINGPVSISIDAYGDAWIVNANTSTISKLSGNGAPLSPATGFTGGSQAIPVSIAVDGSQDAWVADSGSSNLTEYSVTGVPVSPVGGFTGGGLSSPQSVAVFGNGAVWVANFNGGTGSGSVSKFTNGGVAQSGANGFSVGGINRPVNLAVDASGSVWVANQGASGSAGSVSKLNSTGTAVTTTAGYTGGGINFPFSIAFDNGGHAWIANYTGNSLTELDSAGNALSPSTGFTGGGLSSPYSVAIDGDGTVWTANFGNNSIGAFSNGTALSPATGYANPVVNGPQSVAVDGAGSVWVANANATSVTQLVGIAAPVVTPLATAAATAALGTRP